ncbi:DUF3570 domain-containing protein [Teredinibacter waterburyi]|jgi:Protein of unknown function (DUF3570).|uniref:DUF3570 domain-containing protein n=1 Tax=Teredinibacter waterburyi TaxID=1500538 RepID=UPI00165F119F|nr:DUF3570 domain-containing protein [Teredinibacter waterburyi]
MQLGKHKKISHLLSAAACTLVGGGVQAEEMLKDWDIDTAVLIYNETDRVSAMEGVVQATKDFGEGHIFSGKLVVDSLSGASANGALPQPEAQTMSRPSGKGQFETAAAETPLDDTFKDTRVQINGQWTQPLMTDLRASGGLHLSKEFDYQSIAINGSLAKDFNRKNTTLSVGFSQAFDQISPHGGRPVALSDMVIDSGQFATDQDYWDAFDATRQTAGEDTKNTTDLVLGLTQIINRRWITQFNVGISDVSGYMTDPFKVVTQVDDQGNAVAQTYENRPDSRSKAFFFAQSKVHLDKNILDLSYRYSQDDWGIDSHTLELRDRFSLGGKSYLQPHLRYYQQTAADFYQRYQLSSTALPDYMSADYRIGEMSAYTMGLKYGRELENGHEFSLRFEYYQQSSSGPSSDLPALNGLELYPEVKAAFLQLGYSF